MKLLKISAILTLVFVLAILISFRNSAQSEQERSGNEKRDSMNIAENSNLRTAILAGGCFWCMEGPFEKLEGVKSVTSGYTGGKKSNPTYKEVAAGLTEHAEAVEILYDPDGVSYAKLLEVFWRNINPTQVNGQFADKGRQYRTAIFYHNEEERKLAEKSKKELENSKKFDKPIATEIVPASKFYPAEEYHQDYYKKNPFHYQSYRRGSGREAYLKRTWGSESQ